MTASRPNISWDWAEGLVAVLVLGYLSMTRTFAHLGVHPLYVGEASLVVFLVLRFSGVIGTWLGALSRPGPLSGFSWALFLSLVYGAVQLGRCLLAGHLPMTALQNSVFHVYPLFFFVGVSVGVRNPDFLRKLVKLLAWWIALYGIPYVLVLGRLSDTPDLGSHVATFGQPTGGGSVSILGLLSLESGLGPVWPLVVMDSLVVLGVQSRAEWLSFSFALLVWGHLSGRLGQVLRVAALVLALLAIGYVTDFSIPSPTNRGGDISTRALIGRAVAAVAPDKASALTDRADSYAGTVSWRTEWWARIWKMVHGNPTCAIIGAGFGYPLWDLHPEPLEEEVPVRTPHSIVMFLLGYTGWTGLAVFYLMQLTLGAMQYRVFRQTGQAFGICLWLQIMVWAPFDPFFETPFAVIPAYLLLGLAAAPCLQGPRTESPMNGRSRQAAAAVPQEPS
jgi:hypothetical protein